MMPTRMARLARMSLCLLATVVGAASGGCTNYTKVAVITPPELMQSAGAAELNPYDKDTILIARSVRLKRYGDAEYSEVLEQLRERYEAAPGLEFPYTEEYLKQEFVGSTILWLKNWVVTLRGAIALVPRVVEGTESWASREDWKANYGDLVAARTRPSGLLAVTRVLCDNDRYYETCASAYAIGAFDALTGEEIDGQGRRINIRTFRLLGQSDP
ncbi:MAG: hypothetical protein AAF184_22815 [Pseudomonadota bacterium]